MGTLAPFTFLCILIFTLTYLLLKWNLKPGAGATCYRLLKRVMLQITSMYLALLFIYYEIVHKVHNKNKRKK